MQVPLGTSVTAKMLQMSHPFLRISHGSGFTLRHALRGTYTPMHLAQDELRPGTNNTHVTRFITFGSYEARGFRSLGVRGFAFLGLKASDSGLGFLEIASFRLLRVQLCDPVPSEFFYISLASPCRTGACVFK